LVVDATKIYGIARKIINLQLGNRYHTTVLVSISVSLNAADTGYDPWGHSFYYSFSACARVYSHAKVQITTPTALKPRADENTTATSIENIGTTSLGTSAGRRFGFIP
jgi:hypothetical protein